MFFAVTPRGVVVLREKSALTPEQQKLWIRPAGGGAGAHSSGYQPA